MKMDRRTNSDKIMIAVICVIMVIVSFAFLYPLWTTVVQSFSSSRTADSIGFKFWPQEWSLSAYRFVFGKGQIWSAYKNTIIRTVATTSLHVMLTYFGAYGLSRRGMPFKNAITFLIVFTMFFGGGLIPGYLLIKNLGLIGSRWALILPGLTSAWNLVIARNFVQSLPYELEESAAIDGAHPLRIIFQILLPLSKPILAVLALWVAVGQWNAYFDAMLYTNSPEMKPLALLVREMVVEAQGMNENSLMVDANVASSSVRAATIVVSLGPILLVYPFLQKYFVKGVMVGALKG